MSVFAVARAGQDNVFFDAAFFAGRFFAAALRAGRFFAAALRAGAFLRDADFFADFFLAAMGNSCGIDSELATETFSAISREQTLLLLPPRL